MTYGTTSRLPISNLGPNSVASQASKLSSPRCRCLLKSCNRIFTPNHPAQIFCSDQCRLFAKELDWKAAKKRADDKYRRTESGKEKRRAQSKRRRLRIKAEHDASKLAPLSLRVGDTNRRSKKVPEKNLAAEGLGVSFRSNWTQEYLTPNTAALIATTTYVRPSHGYDAGLNLCRFQVQSGLTMPCASFSPGPDRVKHIGLGNALRYAVEPVTGSKNVRGHRRCHFPMSCHCYQRSLHRVTRFEV